MSITPKNWDSFQHYKDRSPAWIKLHRGLLDDYEFSCLPLASRALAPLLWLLASEYEGGKITASLDALAFRLRMKARDLEDALKPLIGGGFFIDDSNVLAQCKRDACLEKERETEKEKEKISCRVIDPTNDDFEEFWKAKPRRKGDNPKAPAKKVFLSLVKQGADPQAIVLGARQWAANNRDKIDTEFIPQAVKWLRDRRWEDYAPDPGDEEKRKSEAEFMRSRGYDWIDEKWTKISGEISGQDQASN